MKEIHDFRIIERRLLGEQYFRLLLKHGGQMQPVAPGQFVEVLVEDEPRVMLRRPISVHDADAEAGTLSLLVQIVGNGTRHLATLAEGDSLNLVYPLGHGFTTAIPAGSKALLVGGGAGIAPLLHLAKALHAGGVHCTVLLGGRTASLIPVQDDFRPYGDLLLATDDGSLGHHGIVTTHPAFADTYDIIYTCGPTPMMKAVARYAREKGVSCEVSLENLMACGLGACLCCVEKTTEGNLCVCKEGPVFNIDRLLWQD